MDVCTARLWKSLVNYILSPSMSVRSTGIAEKCDLKELESKSLVAPVLFDGWRLSPVSVGRSGPPKQAEMHLPRASDTSKLQVIGLPRMPGRRIERIASDRPGT